MTTEHPQWFTSSYSSNGGQCVKVATNLAASHGLVPVGDTKYDDGPILNVSAGAWAAFMEMAKSVQP
ncbi:DUF397 domain-containing protein [Streptomyces dangxiongensis]|uniref:DUF397 domain-containing protein n=1 Tax=Streptomyces dangxiongensis TaxID=1442032 RepID=A0A3G2JJX7_9ACTN|nr:DUF397 domain-containing protein [Streptomyces dangxiongensis]AYN41705.1 DUF397 domain-containing protein [Streptomyces dangxiongensis]